MTNILISLTIFLVIVACVQIIRVSELLSKIKNKDVNEVTDKDNDIQGKLLLFVGLLFIAFVVWQMIRWDHLLLPPASSLHGEKIDSLMSFTMIVILIVFFILTPLLFYFGYKYRGKKGSTAYFFSHNNKLEIIWTIVPTIFLTGVIIFGLRTWDQSMNVDTTDSKVIELYAEQFRWTARYAGDDNILGKANFQLVEGKNRLGVDMNDINSHDDIVTSPSQTAPNMEPDGSANSNIVYLLVNEPVLLKMRSQDVIHSAFLPHFRVQMNCVPGITTQFAFTPTQTTKEMKDQEGDDFEYVLLCNKICGKSHYNMQMRFVVETHEEKKARLDRKNDNGDPLYPRITLSEELLTQN